MPAVRPVCRLNYCIFIKFFKSNFLNWFLKKGICFTAQKHADSEIMAVSSMPELVFGFKHTLYCALTTLGFDLMNDCGWRGSDKAHL